LINDSSFVNIEPKPAKAPNEGGTMERLLDEGTEVRALSGALVGSLPNARLAARRKPARTAVRAGLDDVTVAETRLSDVDGQRGRLVYAGHDAVALARAHSFEDVWSLLVLGELPSDGSFAARTAALRALPLDVESLRAVASTGGSPMLLLQAAIAATGSAWRLRPWLEREIAPLEDEALRLAAALPGVVAALWRLSRGAGPISPRPELGFAANLLWMLHGEAPAAGAAAALDRYLILTADHGMNASTFTARVIASTGADLASAVAGAAGALSGPLHGGAPSLVLDMLDEIGTPERAAPWLDHAVARGRRLMGFGHRVYRTEDPRAACLRETAIALGGARTALAIAVEAEALRLLRARKPGRALYTNVEFWAAVVLESAAVPRELFTPTFALSRTVGWTAHVLEQVRGNRLIRPASRYVGPRPRRRA
jgi:citrate synthase